MKYIKQIIFILSIIYSLESFTQESSKKVMFISNEFILPTDEVSIKNVNKNIENQIWEVYSDRVYTRAYDSPEGYVKSTLEYLNRYYVIEESKKYLHLIKDDHLLPEGVLSDSAINIGWVKKEDLLLWKHCLISLQNNLNKKVFLTSDVYLSLTKEKIIESVQSNVFIIDLYYIYKEGKSRLLLGKIPRISGSPSNINDFIIGWIPKSAVTEWDNNMAIELNQDPQAFKERREKKIEATIYKYKSSAKIAYRKGKNKGAEYIWTEEQSNKNYVKFPVLEFYKNIAKVKYVNNSITNNSVQIKDGYCAAVSNKLDENIFNYVILFSGSKFTILINYYKELINSINSNNPRADFVNSIIKFSINNSVAFNTYNQLTNYQLGNIEKQLFGGFNPNSKIGKIKICDIQNPKIITGKELRELKKKLEKNLIELEKIYNSDNYLDSYFQNGMKYYWLSADYLL
ncbi:MAG: hypothetical protein K8R58_04345 [Bacteroidales bacterium]|nr:hypothetical protein [Bacteroidales bacterium]